MPTSSVEPAGPRAHLELSGVSAGYGHAPVIRSIDLTVGREEVVSVVRPNGAGKSTLLKTRSRFGHLIEECEPLPTDPWGWTMDLWG